MKMQKAFFFPCRCLPEKKKQISSSCSSGGRQVQRHFAPQATEIAFAVGTARAYRYRYHLSIHPNLLAPIYKTNNLIDQ
jgi:hypothetical protein